MQTPLLLLLSRPHLSDSGSSQKARRSGGAMCWQWSWTIPMTPSSFFNRSFVCCHLLLLDSSGPIETNWMCEACWECSISSLWRMERGRWPKQIVPSPLSPQMSVQSFLELLQGKRNVIWEHLWAEKVKDLSCYLLIECPKRMTRNQAKNHGQGCLSIDSLFS